MTQSQRPKSSRWKWVFLILLTANVIALTTIGALLFWPITERNSSEAHYTHHAMTAPDSSEFVVRTTKNNLNQLVNAYIEKLTADTKHHYRIELEEDVHLIGELPVFSTTVPLSIHLIPFVQENGDVILKQKSISIGLLQLPNKKIMEYMAKFLPMPDWVTIHAAEEEIYVALTEMEIKSNFRVSVEQFDLARNELAFKINIPYETLGIDRLN